MGQGFAILALSSRFLCLLLRPKRRPAKSPKADIQRLAGHTCLTELTRDHLRLRHAQHAGLCRNRRPLDLTFGVCPIWRADFFPGNLPTRQARQGVDKVDRSRAFEFRQVCRSKVQYGLFDVFRRSCRAIELDHRADLLSPFLVGDTNCANVFNIRMPDEDLIDLAWVDVHAAGDNTFGRSPRQEQIAIRYHRV